MAFYAQQRRLLHIISPNWMLAGGGKPPKTRLAIFSVDKSMNEASLGAAILIPETRNDHYRLPAEAATATATTTPPRAPSIVCVCIQEEEEEEGEERIPRHQRNVRRARC